MRVPAWHELHFVPFEKLPFVDDVLNNLVEGVADVEVAIGVWGAIVQCEGLGVLGNKFVVHIDRVPERLDLWFLLLRHRSDVEVCEGEVHCGAVHICMAPPG